MNLISLMLLEPSELFTSCVLGSFLKKVNNLTLTFYTLGFNGLS